jgi:hypothetical protein
MKTKHTAHSKVTRAPDAVYFALGVARSCANPATSITDQPEKRMQSATTIQVAISIPFDVY